MARKKRERLVVEKNEKAIKRGCRLKAMGRFFAIVFVLLYIGLIIGSTAFVYKTAEKAWDEYIGIEAGVPFKDLFTIFKGVRKTDENAIVTNAYGEDDVKEFYANIKRKAYLSQDFDLDIMKLLGSVMGGSEDENVAEQTDIVFDGEADEEQTEVVESTGNSALDGLLNTLEFDFSSLSTYNGEKNILEISDRQLAGFFSEALTGLATYFPQISEIEQAYGIKINEVLEIKQIIISGDPLNPESVGFKVTIGLKMKDLVAGLVKAYDLPSIINSIMPKYLYASVTVYPSDRTRGIQVAINAMSEVNVDKIVSIADVVLSKTGKDMSIAGMLIEVNSKIVDVIEKAQEIIPIVFTASADGGGNVDTYPIETLMKFLGVEISEQAFLYMIKDIKLPTAESLGFDVYTQAVKDRDTQAFILQLTSKYGIDNSNGQIGVQNTIADVLDFVQGEDIINKLNLNSIVHADTYVEKDVKVSATFQALSNMLSQYVNANEMMGSIRASIVNASYDKNVLAVDIQVDVSAMLGFDGSGAVGRLISQLVPDSIFVTAHITLDEDGATSVEINKVGSDSSKTHLQTLTSLAESFGMDVSTLSYDYICEQIDGGIRQGLAQIKEQLGYEIIFDGEKAYLPSLYEIISGTSIVNGDLQEDEHYFTPEEIHKLLKHLYNAEYAFDTQGNPFTVAENLDAFIEELYEKFFISESFKRQLQTAQEENKLLDTLTNIGGEAFQMTNIRLEDVKDVDTGKVTIGLKSRSNVTDVSSGDWESINQQIIAKFNPVFSIEEFAYLIENQVNFEQALTFMKDVEIVFANNYSSAGDDYIRLVVRGKGNITNVNATTLLPEYIYMDISIDLGESQPDGSRSDMYVFKMDVHQLAYMPELSGQTQDLQLLTMLIDRVNANANGASQTPDGEESDQPQTPEESQPAQTTSLDKIATDIQVKLNGSDGSDGAEPTEGFKDKLYNDTFTVAFIDNGGFIIEQTVYQIMLNAIYGDKASSADGATDKPSELDFRNALCKSNSIPDTVTVDGRAISLVESNEEQVDRAVDDINEKYAFTDSNKISASNLEGVFSDIGNKAGNYANAIDGAKLTANGASKTLQDLRPEIYEGELLTFLENSVTLTLKGYEDTKMFGLYVTARDKMTIIYLSGIQHSGSKYDEVLPSELALLVNVDTTLLKTDLESTEIFFNDLSESEVRALEVVRNKITSPDSEQISSLDTASAECSDSVKNTMSALTDNMDVEFVYEDGEGVMILQSIYEISATKISLATPEQSAIRAEELKEMLEGLFAEFALCGYTGATGDISGVSGTKVTLGDGNIAGKINVEQLMNNLNMSDKSSGALVLRQSAIVSAGDANLNALRESLGDGRLSDSNNYFLLTYQANTQSAIGASLSLLPSTLYLTFYFDVSDAESIYMVYGGLSDAQANILARLMSVNADGATAFTDASNLAVVREQILGTTVYGAITVADLFGRGTCVPISQASGNNVLGVGAITAEI